MPPRSNVLYVFPVCLAHPLFNPGKCVKHSTALGVRRGYMGLSSQIMKRVSPTRNQEYSMSLRRCDHGNSGSIRPQPRQRLSFRTHPTTLAYYRRCHGVYEDTLFPSPWVSESEGGENGLPVPVTTTPMSGAPSAEIGEYLTRLPNQ